MSFEISAVHEPGAVDAKGWQSCIRCGAVFARSAPGYFVEGKLMTIYVASAIDGRCGILLAPDFRLDLCNAPEKD